MCSTMAKGTRVTVALGDYNENVRRLVRRDRGSCEVFELERLFHSKQGIRALFRKYQWCPHLHNSIPVFSSSAG